MYFMRLQTSLQTTADGYTSMNPYKFIFPANQNSKPKKQVVDKGRVYS